MPDRKYSAQEGTVDRFHAVAFASGGYVVRYASLLLLPVCVSAVCFYAVDCVHFRLETMHRIIYIESTGTAVYTAVPVL